MVTVDELVDEAMTLLSTITLQIDGFHQRDLIDYQDTVPVDSSVESLRTLLKSLRTLAKQEGITNAEQK